MTDAEIVEMLARAFRKLPLHGDAGCDKLTDDEWVTVAESAHTTLRNAGLIGDG